MLQFVGLNKLVHNMQFSVLFQHFYGSLCKTYWTTTIRLFGLRFIVTLNRCLQTRPHSKKKNPIKTERCFSLLNQQKPHLTNWNVRGRHQTVSIFMKASRIYTNDGPRLKEVAFSAQLWWLWQTPQPVLHNPNPDTLTLSEAVTLCDSGSHGTPAM